MNWMGTKVACKARPAVMEVVHTSTKGPFIDGLNGTQDALGTQAAGRVDFDLMETQDGSVPKFGEYLPILRELCGARRAERAKNILWEKMQLGLPSRQETL